VAAKRLIYQVLLFQDRALSLELGACLWAAFEEVQTFYNRALPAEYRRLYAAPAVAKHVVQEDADRIVRIDDKFPWESAAGGFAGTYKAEKVVQLVREMFALEAESYVVIVIDKELTPPQGWRYIIWDGDDKTWAVISIAPIDPHYWRQETKGRIATIKHRVRTACLDSVGVALGLEECDNLGCFLLKDVDSVENLDAMVCLGPEHKQPELTNCGFWPTPANPDKVQRVSAHMGPLFDGGSDE
jgi:hypothetical protein